MSDQPTNEDFENAFRMVGEFLFNWASMEHSLNDLIGKMLGFSVSQRIVVTNNIKLHDKLAIAGAGFDLVHMDEASKKTNRKTLKAISNLANDRNTCAHEMFAPLGDGVRFFRFQVRGKMFFSDVIWSNQEHRAKCREADRLEKELDAITSKIGEIHNLEKLAKLLAEAPIGDIYGLGQSSFPYHPIPAAPGYGLLGPIPETTPQTPSDPDQK